MCNHHSWTAAQATSLWTAGSTLLPLCPFHLQEGFSFLFRRMRGHRGRGGGAGCAVHNDQRVVSHTVSAHSSPGWLASYLQQEEETEACVGGPGRGGERRGERGPLRGGGEGGGGEQCCTLLQTFLLLQCLAWLALPDLLGAATHSPVVEEQLLPGCYVLRRPQPRALLPIHHQHAAPQVGAQPAVVDEAQPVALEGGVAGMEAGGGGGVGGGGGRGEPGLGSWVWCSSVKVEGGMHMEELIGYSY